MQRPYISRRGIRQHQGLVVVLIVIVRDTKKDSRMKSGKKRASTRSNAIALSSKGVTA